MTRPLDNTGLKRLHRSWRRKEHPRLALILDGVQSPFNVGNIVRTAAAYRVDQVWTVAPTPDLDDSTVGRTAMGTDRYLEWTSCATGTDAVAAAHAAGYEVIALELSNDAEPAHDTGLADDICLVVGHEDRGVAKVTLAACDRAVYLPQLGRVGSLNVANATAIAIWETRRRAW